VTVAVLYDIHGNLPALEAVLADTSAAGVSGFVLGGDYALFGPFPSETVARLRSLDGEVTWIRGNVDRWCFDPDSAPEDEVLRGALAACRDALGPSVVAELGMLGQQVVIERTRFCHASPLSDLQSFMPEAADDEDELLADADERRIVFGHTHLAFRRVRDDGVELFNPGSVGFPFDGDQRAAYALLHDDGSLEHRRVAYDVSAATEALSALADRLGSASGDTPGARPGDAPGARPGDAPGARPGDAPGARPGGPPGAPPEGVPGVPNPPGGAAWASRSMKWLQDARR
jgi:predicted phosphodiesterase